MADFTEEEMMADLVTAHKMGNPKLAQAIADKIKAQRTARSSDPIAGSRVPSSPGPYPYNLQRPPMTQEDKDAQTHFSTPDAIKSLGGPRDLAVGTGAMLGGAGASAILGAGASIPASLAMRAAGGGVGGATSGALADWIGGKKPGFESITGDAAAGALGEGVFGPALSTLGGAAKGAFTRPSQAIADAAGVARPTFREAINSGGESALRAHLNPISHPFAPNKEGLISPENVAAVGSLPRQDVQRIADTQYPGKIKSPLPGYDSSSEAVAPNIIPLGKTAASDAIQGGRAAGLRELKQTSSNLDRAKALSEAKTEDSAASSELRTELPNLARSLAGAEKGVDDSLRGVRQTVMRNPPPPRVPSSSPAPTTQEASDIAQSKGAVHDFLQDNSTRPVPSGAIDPEAGLGITPRDQNLLGTSGELQVPMDEQAIIQAAEDPNAFRSTARSPEVHQLAGNAKAAEAAPAQREARTTASRNWHAQEAHDLTAPEAGQRPMSAPERTAARSNPTATEQGGLDPSVHEAALKRVQAQTLVDHLTGRANAARKSLLAAELATKDLPPGYGPGVSHEHAQDAIARLSAGGAPSTLAEARPSGLVSPAKVIRNEEFGALRNLFRNEPLETTQRNATARTIDMANKRFFGGDIVGSGGKTFASDLSDPLAPSVAQIVKRIAGAGAVDTAGQIEGRKAQQKLAEWLSSQR